MKPLGYYLKHLDTLIDQSFDRALSDTGITRRHWQLLNEARNGTLPDDPLVSDLLTWGWVADGALTPEGERAFDETRARVDSVRTALMGDLTVDEYTATVATLEKMAANLEAAGPAAR